MVGLSGRRSRGEEGTVLRLWLGEGHVALGAVVPPHDDGDAADGGSIAA